MTLRAIRLRAFLARHERLIDDLAAAGAGIIAIGGYYLALALFAH